MKLLKYFQCIYFTLLAVIIWPFLAVFVASKELNSLLGDNDMLEAFFEYIKLIWDGEVLK